MRNVPSSAQGFAQTRSEAVALASDLILKECTYCGLVQLTSPPVPYHMDVIRSTAVSPVLLEQKRDQFKRFIDQHDLRGSKILEVGCGKGEFLSILNRLEIQAFGIENSPTSVARCLASGLSVEQGYISSASSRLHQCPFDAFIFLMFLEHVPAPRNVLTGIAANLVDGAPGIIEVPSFDFLLRKNLLTEFVTDHLTYFTKTTLASLLTTSGFEILTMQESRDDYVLSATVRKRIPLTLQDSNPTQGKLAKDIHSFLQTHASKSIAVWGAGHQALTSIALFGMASQVSMIVDSAPPKQGLFAPGSGLPIYPPSALKENGINTVIVMAGSYSNEIVQILGKDFPSVIYVAVAKEDHLVFPETVINSM